MTRPSDRAIAQAFLAYAGHCRDADHDLVRKVMDAAEALDATAAPVVVDGSKLLDALIALYAVARVGRDEDYAAVANAATVIAEANVEQASSRACGCTGSGWHEDDPVYGPCDCQRLARATPVVVGEDAVTEVIEAAQPFLADPNPQLGGGYLVDILVQASATRRLKAAIKCLTAALAGD